MLKGVKQLSQTPTKWLSQESNSDLSDARATQLWSCSPASALSGTGLAEQQARV